MNTCDHGSAQAPSTRSAAKGLRANHICVY